VGQKTNPISLRLKINRKQDSSWFADHKYTKNLVTEIRIRNYLERVFKFSNLPISRIIIQLLPKKINLYPFFKYISIRRKKRKGSKVLKKTKRKQIIYQCKRKLLKLKAFDLKSIRKNLKDYKIASKINQTDKQSVLLQKKIGIGLKKKNPRRGGTPPRGVDLGKKYTEMEISDIIRFLILRKKCNKEKFNRNQEYTKTLKKHLYITKNKKTLFINEKRLRTKFFRKLLESTPQRPIGLSGISHVDSTPPGVVSARRAGSASQSFGKTFFNRFKDLKKRLDTQISRRKKKEKGCMKKPKGYLQLQRATRRLQNHSVYNKNKVIKLRNKLESYLKFKKAKSQGCKTRYNIGLFRSNSIFKKKTIRKNLLSKKIKPKKKHNSILFFIKYLLKSHQNERTVIKNSLFLFKEKEKKEKNAIYKRPYLLTNSIENIESVFYNTLKCNTSLFPLKVRNPLKSAYFLALFISVGLKRKNSLRQIFKKITKMTKIRKKNKIKIKSKDKKKKQKKTRSIKGIRILCSGRINGVEKAKVQSKRLGQTSLHFFSEKIDYSCIHVNTKFGIIGVKVWICFKK